MDTHSKLQNNRHKMDLQNYSITFTSQRLGKSTERTPGCRMKRGENIRHYTCAGVAAASIGTGEGGNEEEKRRSGVHGSKLKGLVASCIIAMAVA